MTGLTIDFVDCRSKINPGHPFWIEWRRDDALHGLLCAGGSRTPDGGSSPVLGRKWALVASGLQ